MIRNCYIYSSGPQGTWGTAIRLYNVSHARVENCTFVNCDWAIYIPGLAQDVVIRHINITDCIEGVDISSTTDLVFEDSLIISTIGTWSAFDAYNCANIRVEDIALSGTFSFWMAGIMPRPRWATTGATTRGQMRTTTA